MNQLQPNKYAIKIKQENTTFLGWKVVAITLHTLNNKWCWILWTHGFHFGGNSKYDTSSIALEAAYLSIEESNKLMKCEDMK